MTGITRFGLCAATVAALSAAASGGAQAFSFNETVVVHPIVHNTFVMGVTHDDHWTCGIFSCFNTNGLIPDSAATVLLKPFNDRIAVGYDYFMDPGTQPCACQSYGLVQMRGGVSFRTLDIPDNFLVATLVLTPLHADQFGAPLNPSLLNGLYQTSGKTVTFSEPAATTFIHSFDKPYFSFDHNHDRWTFVTGQVGSETASSFPAPGNAVSNPVFSSFPASPGPTTQPVQRNGNTYRINVSNTVRDWISNWPNRLDTPLHSFLITGQNFAPEDIKKADSGFIEGTFLVQYAVTLEFVLLEPDL
jgi:hypothetical protein